MDSPTVTVVIPTFNRADYIGACLDSLLKQSLKPSQIIVVDDGSSDPTPAAVEPYLSDVEYISKSNGGKSSAVNIGLGAVKSDYVWIFDDDDVLLPLLESCFLGGATIFVRAQCYDRVGKFDERLVRSQDYDMAIRIARYFSGVRVDGGPLFHVRQHGGPRGSVADGFAVEANVEKWRSYNEIIFRKVRDSFELQEYLPPGSSVEREERRAHLQRFRILATRLPLLEVLCDLESAFALEPHRALSRVEGRIVQESVAARVDHRSLSTSRDFVQEVRRLAQSSRAGRSLRLAVLRGMMTPDFSRGPRVGVGLLRRSVGLIRWAF